MVALSRESSFTKDHCESHDKYFVVEDSPSEEIAYFSNWVSCSDVMRRDSNERQEAMNTFVAVPLHNESAIKSVDDHSTIKEETATVREGIFPSLFLLVNTQSQNTAWFLNGSETQFPQYSCKITIPRRLCFALRSRWSERTVNTNS